MEKILNTPMTENDAEAGTVKEYLCKLLTLVIMKEEGFNGKRPFGNSGWKCDLYYSLLNKHVDDGISSDEEEDCDRALLAAIRYMCL